jgi:acetyltransferase-like isoleucine patch superfamily enzyme
MKLHRLRNLLFFFPSRIYAKIAPVSFAKKRGVKMHGKVRFYGVPLLGTEPWLITMGNNVHITKNVEFITHDGGTLLFRNEIPDLDITKGITIGNNVYIGINT